MSTIEIEEQEVEVSGDEEAAVNAEAKDVDKEGDDNPGDNAEKDGGEAESEKESFEISLGDEELNPEEEAGTAPGWVKDLRKSHREQQKENKSLRSQIEKLTEAKQKNEILGARPTLEDHDYDSDQHDAALDVWYQKKQNVQLESAKLKADQDAASKEWGEKVAAHSDKTSKLPFDDIKDSHEVVDNTLDQTQIGTIIHVADDSALLMYAIGKNPQKAEELAKIKDPSLFIKAITKMEDKLVVKKRKAATKPEGSINGDRSISGTLDNELDRLRAEAEKTGNYTKVHAYRRKKKAAT